ncbi:MAG: nickel-dependent lactate racemase, partial [Planctomycetota bacterium]
GFMERILQTDYFVKDQWQLEELARVRRHATVKVVTDGLSAETLGRLFVEPAESVEAAVADALAEHGRQATIAVIPEGPYVMAELE